MKAILCLVVALAFVMACLSGCETIQGALSQNRPTARLMDLKFEDATLDSAKLLFDVEVENHYPVALPLTNFDYGLSTGSEQFLSGSADSQTTVAAKSKEMVSLPVTVNYMEMLKALKGIRPGSKIPYNAELGLSVDAPALGLIRLPLQKKGELLLPSVSGSTISDVWNIVKPK